MSAMRHRIELCMGSSCFVRGNQRNATLVAEWVRRHGIAADITGHHCRECCATGPIITIDGTPMVVDDEGVLDTQLRQRLH